MNDQQRKIFDVISLSKVFHPEYYLAQNPDVKAAKMDPLEHFIVAGDSEGRNPSPFFDVKWYRSQTGLALGSANSLAHYLIVGEKQGLQPIIGLDPEYIRQQVANRPGPALVSFIEAKTFKSHLNPNPFFDYDFYLSRYPDIQSSELDPYLHFIHYGAAEGRVPSNGFSWSYIRERFNLVGDNKEVYTKLMANWRRLEWSKVQGEPSVVLIQEEVRENHRPSPQHETQLKLNDTTNARDVDIFAFYLPQFHRVKENDEWWGTGFTEWHNVVRGMPRFRGHYQPRIPADLGFYDLDDPAIMRKQVEMAKTGGLAGLAFYYYHFGSQRLLEKPLNAFRDDKSLDTGYFLIWANETWSRRWDGSEKEILLEQTYPSNLIDELADDFVNHFADKRYKTVDGRPLLVIYRVSQLPNPANFVKTLRTTIKKRGFDPVIYLAQSFEDSDPSVYGLDGAMEFPPHKLTRDMQTITPERVYEKSADLRVYSYDNFVEKAKTQPREKFNLIRTCFPSWDNDGRRQGASSVVHGATPKKFTDWLSHLVNEAESIQGHPKIVCINAWNEWGEGAYLEPDRRFGFAYLNVVQRVKYPQFEANYGKVVLVGHDAFAGGAQRLLLSIGTTLKEQFGVEIRFVLLRADPGYDILLEQYKAVADTIVIGANVESELQSAIAELRDAGFNHAICNTSVTATAIKQFDVSEWEVILLVHELENMLKQIGAIPVFEEYGSKFKKIIAPSQTIAKLLKSFSAPNQNNFDVIPQGIYKKLRQINTKENERNLLSHLGLNTKPKVVVGIGYADKRKGIDIFLETCDEISTRDPNTLFIWQGNWDPTLRVELTSLIEKLESRGNLMLVPNHEHIEEVLAVADVFFLSSREDPLPTVAFEAWAFGVPVVSFRGAGGISELIQKNSELGMVAKIGSTQSTVNAIRDFIGANSSAAQIEARRSWVKENCNWVTYVAKLLSSLYELPSLDAAIVGHNHGRFAPKRISSIVEQTLPARTIRYVDIASSDNSLEIIRELVDTTYSDRVTVEAFPTNHKKLYKTWIELASQSDAKYIHIGEGDDYVSAEFFERCVCQLEKYSRAAFAFSAVSWCDEEDKIITASHAPYVEQTLGEFSTGGGFLNPKEILGSKFAKQNPILSLSSTVWNRKIFLSVLKNNIQIIEKGTFAYDWLLYGAVFNEGFGAIYIPSTLTTHRQHSKSMSAAGNVSHEKEISKVQNLLNKYYIL